MMLRRAAASLFAVCALIAAPLAAPAAARDRVAGGVHTYEVNVKTGTADGAGTNSNVRIRIKGSLAETAWITLDDDNDNHEAGRLDRYKIKHHDVGELLAIDVWSDHTGNRPDWFLDWILITDGDETGLFRHGNWFTKNQIVSIDNSV